MSDSIQLLAQSVSRIENLNAEMDNIKNDVSEIYKELKDNGFDTKIVRKLIKIRAMNEEELMEEESLLETYKNAVEQQMNNSRSTDLDEIHSLNNSVNQVTLADDNEHVE